MDQGDMTFQGLVNCHIPILVATLYVYMTLTFKFLEEVVGP